MRFAVWTQQVLNRGLITEDTGPQSAAEAVAPSTVLEPAIERTRPGAERCARTTMVATLAAADIGTSGVLADGKHAGRRAAWATPQTGSDRGRPGGATSAPPTVEWEWSGLRSSCEA
jgi:hypothetical protein